MIICPCLLLERVISKCISFCCEPELGMPASCEGHDALMVQGLQPERIVGLISYSTFEGTMISVVKVQRAPC